MNVSYTRTNRFISVYVCHAMLSTSQNNPNAEQAKEKKLYMLQLNDFICIK